MIIFKVVKASRLCVLMSVFVFCVMGTVLVLEHAPWPMAVVNEVVEEAGEAETETEQAAVPAMAAVDWPVEESPGAQQTPSPSGTPSLENLFYLPAPEATEKTAEVEPEDVPDQADTLRIQVLKDTPEPEKEAGARAPRVLIYHTHTWEAYEPTREGEYTPTERWRTKDEAHNVVRVGEVLAECLEEAGFWVVHERTAFEPPVLSTAYTRSLAMLEAYAQQGETFDYYIDLHRDAYSAGVYKENTVTGPDGQALARLMMLIGKGTGETGGVGFDVKPDWEQNLLLANDLTERLNAQCEGLCGKVKIKTGRFNQHVSTNAILIEVGNNMNTLEEALASMPFLARALIASNAAQSGL